MVPPPAVTVEEGEQGEEFHALAESEGSVKGPGAVVRGIESGAVEASIFVLFVCLSGIDRAAFGQYILVLSVETGLVLH